MNRKPLCRFGILPTHLASVLAECERGDEPYLVSCKGRGEIETGLRCHPPTVVVSDFDDTIGAGNSFTRLWAELPADLQKIYGELLALHRQNQLAGIEKVVLESGMISLLAASLRINGWDERQLKGFGATAELRKGAKEFFGLFPEKHRCLVSISFADYVSAAMKANKIDVFWIFANELLYRAGRKRSTVIGVNAVFAAKPDAMMTSETKWSAVCQRLPQSLRQQRMLCIGDYPLADHTLWRPNTFNVLIRPAFGVIPIEQVLSISHQLDLIVSDLPALTVLLRENGIGTSCSNPP